MKIRHLCFTIVLFVFMLVVTGCESKQSLLENAVYFEDDVYKIPGVTWFCTKAELAETLKISESDFTWLRNEDYKLPDSFSENLTPAVFQRRFLFHNDLLMGEDFILISHSEEEQDKIAKELTKQVNSLLASGMPELCYGSVEDLMGDKFNLYWDTDENSSSFRIDGSLSENGFFTYITVRAPREDYPQP